MKNVTIGGVLLIIGILIFLVTVYLEIQIGWIGSPNSQDPEFVPSFIKDNWGDLNLIWGWQAFANFLFTLAYFHLTNIKRSLFQIPIGSFWAVLFVLSIMTLVSFGITLGAYERAVSVYNTNPDLFDTIRAAVLGLYGFGSGFGQLILLLILIFETFSKDGYVHRTLGIIVIILLLISFATIMFKVVPGKLMGLTFLLMPLTLGYCYFRHSTDFEND